jgi:hypothetical protein
MGLAGAPSSCRRGASLSLQLPTVALIAAGAFVLGHLQARGGGSSRGGGSTSGAGGTAAAPPALRDMGELGQEFLAASGILQLRPPLKPAASGSSGYVVQPSQILSWFPRCGAWRVGGWGAGARQGARGLARTAAAQCAPPARRGVHAPPPHCGPPPRPVLLRRTVLFPNFISPERCRHIIELARGKLDASGLAWRPDETPDPNQETRTSSGTFLEAGEDDAGVLAWLEERIAAVTMLPVHHGEVGVGGQRGGGRVRCLPQVLLLAAGAAAPCHAPAGKPLAHHRRGPRHLFSPPLSLSLALSQAFNVLRYQLGAKYDSHMARGIRAARRGGGGTGSEMRGARRCTALTLHPAPSHPTPKDTFDPEVFGAQKSQRMATMLIYLSGGRGGGRGLQWGRHRGLKWLTPAASRGVGPRRAPAGGGCRGLGFKP